MVLLVATILIPDLPHPFKIMLSFSEKPTISFLFYISCNITLFEIPPCFSLEIRDVIIKHLWHPSSFPPRLNISHFTVILCVSLS